MNAVLENPISQNPMLLDLNKHFKDDGINISTASAVLQIATDEESVKTSELIVTSSLKCKKSLPIDIKGDVKQVKKFISHQQDNIATIDDFLNFVSDYNIDDKNAKKVVSNFKKAKDITIYMFDYMQLVLHTYESINEVKKDNNSYSFKEFKNLISN